MSKNKYICISTLCFITICLSAGAQQIQRQVAVSAYIYNFAKNIEWQNEESIKVFNFLIIGQDESIIQEMAKMSKLKKLKDKPIKVTYSKTLNDFDNVNLIFVLKGEEANIVNIFDKIEGKNILLVTDGYLDKRLIMINFYNSEKGNLLFEINKANIINQNLKIKQDMILLGGTEVDVAALYQEGQQSLRSIQKHSDVLENNLSKLESNLKNLEKTVLLKNKEVIDGKDSLARLSIKIAGQQNILDKQSKLLILRETEMNLQINKMDEQQKLFDQQTKELKSQALDLKKGKETLQKQKQDISDQKNEIKIQSKILSDQGLTIHRQRNLLFLLIIIIVLVFILVFSIYSSYKGKKKLTQELEKRVQERTHDLNDLNYQLKMELTERKKIEEEIKELNLTLENRVAERTTQLVDINKELESFSYSISHDLRAPLRAIFGFSQILSHRHRESLNDEGKQYMDYIVEASIRMEQLINDLLNYSRLGRKSLDIRPVALGEIIGNVYLDFKQKMEEIGAEFKIDEAYPVIPGDESLFRQIFTNLIDNAINYRRTEIPLEIVIHCAKELNGYRISISDNGIGIPQEYWEKIFNIFQRLHSEDQYPGTGIGLATVKKAVSMLNGSIKVESIIGKGSIFIINLPEHKM